MDFDITKIDEYEVDTTSNVQQFIDKFNNCEHTILFGWSKPETLEHATLNSIVRHIKKTIRSMPIFDRRKK